MRFQYALVHHESVNARLARTTLEEKNICCAMFASQLMHIHRVYLIFKWSLAFSIRPPGIFNLIIS